jgi:cation diffusion facilitator CzcD-associated flavoprotein CzcO
MSQSKRNQSAPSELDLLIVGAGFAGLCMLVSARKLGLTALCLEAAPSVGGTWYHNRYPGARVDIESLEYSCAFSEELQQEWSWSERYSAQPEILRYANHIADRFDLRSDIKLNTRVAEMQWQEDENHWLVKTENAQQWKASFVLLATGPLSASNVPAFKGLEKFKGQVFHTSNWPHEHVALDGKRVGVIGTGSTGVQLIPEIAKTARELTVFQRTAAYVVPSRNNGLDWQSEVAVKSDYAGFRARNKKMMGAYGSSFPPNMVSALAVDEEERQRRFEERWQYGGFFLGGAFNDLLLNAEAGEHASEFVRNKIRSIVKDPKTREALLPHYPFWCKRLCVDSSGYYETYNMPHVRLVDVNAEPIGEFTQQGIVVGDREHALDIVVMATGFDALTGAIKKINVVGRDGLNIQDKWRDGPHNFLGLTINGFPNLFYTAGAGSPSAFTNVLVSIEHHVEWIVGLLTWMKVNGERRCEAKRESEQSWMDHIQTMAEKTTRLGCNSWYLGANIPGKPRLFMPLAGGFPAYAQRCEQEAVDGYPGFKFTRTTVAA